MTTCHLPPANLPAQLPVDIVVVDVELVGITCLFVFPGITDDLFLGQVMP